MSKFIQKLVFVLFAVGAWIGMLYIPSDIFGLPDAYPKLFGWVSKMSKEILLIIFSGVLISYLIWVDWGRNILAWLRQRNSVFAFGTFASKGHPNGGKSIELELEILGKFATAQITVTYNSIGRGSKRTLLKYETKLLRTQRGEIAKIPLASMSGPQENSSPTNVVYWGVSEAIEWAEGDRNTRNGNQELMKIDIEISTSRIFTIQTKTIFAYCCESPLGGPEFIFWEECEAGPNVLMNG